MNVADLDVCFVPYPVENNYTTSYDKLYKFEYFCLCNSNLPLMYLCVLFVAAEGRGE